MEHLLSTTEKLKEMPLAQRLTGQTRAADRSPTMVALIKLTLSGRDKSSLLHQSLSNLTKCTMLLSTKKLSIQIMPAMIIVSDLVAVRPVTNSSSASKALSLSVRIMTGTTLETRNKIIQRHQPSTTLAQRLLYKDVNSNKRTLLPHSQLPDVRPRQLSKPCWPATTLLLVLLVSTHTNKTERLLKFVSSIFN